MKTLTPSEANEIRRLRKHTDMSLLDLAKTYGVTKGAVNHIIQNRTHQDPDYTPIKKETP